MKLEWYLDTQSGNILTNTETANAGDNTPLSPFEFEISVKRVRPSVTQGFAEVYINGQKALSFGDTIYLRNSNRTLTGGWNETLPAEQEQYGEVVAGWGSITSDEEFINGALNHPYEEAYHHLDKIKGILRKQLNCIDKKAMK